MEDINNNICDIFGIRSTFIFQKIFYLLWENRQLNLILYNKAIKKFLNVSLEDYKKSCQKQIIVDENGTTKEFKINTNKLIYEGEYKNKKRHGEGKEYYESGELKFEGEYKNGRRISGAGYDGKGNKVLILENEKGKEYYENKEIQFEGDYLDKRRWNGKGYNYKKKECFEIKNGKGSGKRYNYYGNLIFEGEYINGFMHGKGKYYCTIQFFYYTEEKLIFEGEYYNGLRHGKGKEYDYQGVLTYEGEYSKGLKNGKGKEYQERRRKPFFIL